VVFIDVLELLLNRFEEYFCFVLGRHPHAAVDDGALRRPESPDEVIIPLRADVPDDLVSTSTPVRVSVPISLPRCPTFHQDVVLPGAIPTSPEHRSVKRDVPPTIQVTLAETPPMCTVTTRGPGCNVNVAPLEETTGAMGRWSTQGGKRPPVVRANAEDQDSDAESCPGRPRASSITINLPETEARSPASTPSDELEGSRSMPSSGNVSPLSVSPRLRLGPRPPTTSSMSLEPRPIYPNIPFSPYGSPVSSPRAARRRPLKESRRVSVEKAGSFVQLNQYRLLDCIGKVRRHHEL